MKSMDIYLIISLLFPYKLKFSESYVSLNIDLGSIKVSSIIWTLQIKLSNFDRSSLNQDGSLNYLSLINKKKWAYQSLVLWNLWPFTEKFLLFLYKLKFSEAYVSLNIDLGPIKAPSFLDFADQTEQLCQIYPPFPYFYLPYPINKNWHTYLISVKSMAI